MANTIEATHQTAELALAALKKLGLAATGRNIEVWNAHVCGRNPALSRDIQKCLSAEGRVTQEDADRLFTIHIQRSDLSRSVVEIVERFEMEVAKLSDVVEASGESAQGHGERLQDLSTAMKDAAVDNPAIGALLESVITITKTVREENRKLEQQLQNSSEEVATLRRNVESIQREAMTDPLTGVKNRKSFDLALKQLTDAANREEADLTLILADIDFFKKFNDKWGHQTGDQVLRLVAEVMDANVKGQDTLARYGGEEFAILLPRTNGNDGRMLADRIRKAVESRRLVKRRSNESLGVVTMSMGVASYRPGENPETFVDRADQCLYLSKDAGRNTVSDERDLDLSKDLAARASR